MMVYIFKRPSLASPRDADHRTGLRDADTCQEKLKGLATTVGSQDLVSIQVIKKHWKNQVLAKIKKPQGNDRRKSSKTSNGKETCLYVLKGALMFDLPVNGCSVLRINGFRSQFGWLTAVPLDCLNSFIDIFTDGKEKVVRFDAERYIFLLLLSFEKCCIISFQNKQNTRIDGRTN